MKTKIVGWIFIIGSTVLLFSALLTLLTLHDSYTDTSIALRYGVGGIVASIVGFKLGSGIKAHKQWAWKVGLLVVGLVTIGNVVYLIQDPTTGIVSVGVDLFSLFALYSERDLFKTVNAD